MDILLGRKEPPIQNGILTLMEYANAVYSRAQEVTMLILRAENEGMISKGHKLYKYRTGELRHFTEMALRAAELGSRRITVAQMEHDARFG